MPQKIAKCRIWPSGDYSVGFLPREAKRKADEEYDATASRQVLHTVTDPITGQSRKYLEVDAPPLRIGLSPASNLNNRRRVIKGRRGMTVGGKRMVRSAVAMLQEKWGKSRMAFATLTLPNLGECECWYLASRWSEVVARVRQELMRELKRAHAPTNVVIVTEIQTKRWEKYKEVAPHLHIVYKAHAGDFKWYIPANKLREIWKRIISSVLEQEIESANAAVDCQTVKKDVVRYLGKYISKGAEICSEIIEAGCAECLPRHWWSMDAETRDMVKEALIEDGKEVAQFMYENAPDLKEQGLADYSFRVTIPDRQSTQDRVESINNVPVLKTSEFNPGERIVGWAGRLTKAGMQLVKSLFSSRATVAACSV